MKTTNYSEHRSDSLLKVYLEEVGSYPRLSPEEEIALWRNPSAENKAKLINSNLRLVVSIVNKMFPHAYSNEDKFLDLIQEGNLGLMKAIDNFNPRKTTKFSTYAHYWISSYLYAEIGRQKDGVIVKPTRLAAELWFIDRIESLLGISLQREIGDSDLRIVLDGMYSGGRLDELLAARKISMISLERPSTAEEEDDRGLADRIADPNAAEPDGIDHIKQENLLVTRMKAVLPPKLYVIVCAHFGLDEFANQPKTLDEVAQILFEKGLTESVVTRERVRQLEDRAFKRLKNDPEFKKFN